MELCFFWLEPGSIQCIINGEKYYIPPFEYILEFRDIKIDNNSDWKQMVMQASHYIENADILVRSSEKKDERVVYYPIEIRECHADFLNYIVLM